MAVISMFAYCISTMLVFVCGLNNMINKYFCQVFTWVLETKFHFILTYLLGKIKILLLTV